MLFLTYVWIWFQDLSLWHKILYAMWLAYGIYIAFVLTMFAFFGSVFEND